VRRRPTRAYLISTRAELAREWVRHDNLSTGDGSDMLLESARVIAADAEQLASIVDWR
jgi:hypothetical protein